MKLYRLIPILGIALLWAAPASHGFNFFGGKNQNANICAATFYGQNSSGHYDRPDEPGVVVCDYPGSVTDAQCTDMETSGSHGDWCQKYSADHKILYSIARKNTAPIGGIKNQTTPAVCTETFYGQKSTGHYDRPDEKGVVVCDYPGSVTDAQCTDMETSGSHGDWCQKYSADHKFLFSIARKNAAPIGGIKNQTTPAVCSETFYGQTSNEHHDRVEEKGVVVCGYPNPINDADCKDLKTSGANGIWCQKYSADHKFLYSAPRKLAATPNLGGGKNQTTPAVCTETFYGQKSTGHYDRPDEKGVVVCDYPGSVTDAQCTDMETSGSHGDWCQKYSADHKFLFSIARKNAAPIGGIKNQTTPAVCSETFYGQTSNEHHDRVEEKGVVVCGYPNPINDKDCIDLKTQGANGTWCQKYSADHKFLYSAPRNGISIQKKYIGNPKASRQIED